MPAQPLTFIVPQILKNYSSRPRITDGNEAHYASTFESHNRLLRIWNKMKAPVAQHFHASSTELLHCSINTQKTHSAGPRMTVGNEAHYAKAFDDDDHLLRIWNKMKA